MEGAGPTGASPAPDISIGELSPFQKEHLSKEETETIYTARAILEGLMKRERDADAEHDPEGARKMLSLWHRILSSISRPMAAVTVRAVELDNQTCRSYWSQRKIYRTVTTLFTGTKSLRCLTLTGTAND
eukprot:COSAG05_NODE_2649_length_2804_cov_1.828835_2_plen_130_part_00